MTMNISNEVDAFKFAVILYDYLNLHGHKEEAKILSELVDACFPNNAEAIEAHQKAYEQVKNKVQDLPPEHQLTLEASLNVLKLTNPMT